MGPDDSWPSTPQILGATVSLNYVEILGVSWEHAMCCTTHMSQPTRLGSVRIRWSCHLRGAGSAGRTFHARWGRQERQLTRRSSAATQTSLEKYKVVSRAVAVLSVFRSMELSKTRVLAGRGRLKVGEGQGPAA
eukprot:352990-Chlamydomonas_euryale.AAC.2